MGVLRFSHQSQLQEVWAGQHSLPAIHYFSNCIVIYHPRQDGQPQISLGEAILAPKHTTQVEATVGSQVELWAYQGSTDNAPKTQRDLYD